MTRQLIPDPLLKRLDWAAALEETMSPRGEFFPSRIEAHAADVDRSRTLKLLDARLRKGRGLALAEGVAVPRRRLLTAVAHDIPFLDRVVVSALALETMRTLEPDADALAIHLSMKGPEEGDRAEFEQRPLTHEDAGAFVRSDVSAFYDYVDQDLLAVEIAELTGDVDLADATADVLHRLLGRGLGLPQGPRGADVFADLFLSDVDRRMSRAGIHSARLRDEYILATADDATSRRALRVLEDALRERGLGLNAGKTQILSRTDYETGMSVKTERMTAAVMEDAALAGYDFDPDAFEEIDWSDLGAPRVIVGGREAGLCR
jgi:Reverse transcriptase (RNA-dependent DNA polymerase)